LISQDEVMPTIEARLRSELHKYAIELRKLAYTLPNGVGEYHLLQLSERMSAAADAVVGSEEATGLPRGALQNMVTGAGVQPARA
jgi:hypothetical protein